jgi:hypothetical protein
MERARARLYSCALCARKRARAHRRAYARRKAFGLSGRRLGRFLNFKGSAGGKTARKDATERAQRRRASHSRSGAAQRGWSFCAS